MNLLIVGATGGTGRELVKQALERGHRTTALVRNPERLRIAHDRLRITVGNVLDSESLNAAVSGQDSVLCALGHKRWFYPNRILSEGTRNLIRAMERNGVMRLVCETSLGVGSSWGRMGLYYTLFTIPFILPFYYWDKHRQESVVRASNREWIIVRPGVLNNRSPRGTFRHGLRIGNWIWTVRISRADVAAFMLDQINDNRYLRATPGVCW